MNTAGVSQAELSGQIVGMLIISALIAWGMWRGYRLTRDPEGNSKSGLAWMFVLFATWGCSLVGMTARRSIPPTWRILMGFFSLLMMGLFAAGVVLAIIGLVETKRHRERYRRGRGQAVWALVLSGIFVAAFVVGLIFGATKATRLANVPQQRAGSYLIFEEVNFRFSVPGPPWAQMNAKTINPDSKLVFSRALPGCTFVVIAENVADNAVSIDQYVEIVKGNLRSRAEIGAFDVRPLQIGWVTGKRLEATGVFNHASVAYVEWVGEHNGFLYQMVCSGPEANHDFIRQEADRMFRMFDVIDPMRKATSAGTPLVNFYSSPRFGYSVNLPANEWFKWRSLSNDWPAAEFGATKDRRRRGFLIMPVSWPDAPPHWEALASAVLGRMNLAYPPDSVRNEQPFQTNGVEGRTFSFNRTAGKEEFHYRTRIAQGHGLAWLVASIASRDIPDYGNDRAHDALLDAVTFPTAALTSRVIKLSPAERREHGLIYNDVGLYYYRIRQFDRAATWLRHALDQERTNHIILANTLSAISAAHQPADALKLLDERMVDFPGDRDLEARRAALLSETGDNVGALRQFATLFDTGYANERSFVDYLWLLVEHQSRDAARTRAEQWLATKDSVGVRIFLANLMTQEKKFNDAEQLLLTEQTKRGFNPEVSTILAETYIAAGRGSDAVKVCEQMQEKGYDTAQTLLLKGRSELAIKRYREAKTTFESALKQSPANERVKSYLDHVSGILGEGSNSGIKTPIAPVPLPPALHETNAASFTAAEIKEYGAHYEDLVTAIAFSRGKELKTTEFMRVKIHNATGLSRFNSLQFSYDPLGEEIFVNELTVFDSAGKISGTGKVSDYYVVDENNGQSATHHKQLHIPVPGLEAGSTIELTLTRRELGKLETFPFRTHGFSRFMPVKRSLLIVTGDVAQIRHEATAGLSAKTASGQLAWEVRRPPVYRWEPLQQSYEKFTPVVWLNDAKPTWVTESKEYLDTIRERLTPDPDVRDLAMKHAGDAKSPVEKLTRLVRFIQSDVNYKAIEFGRRARHPNAASRTAANRYGDCKDQSVLLYQLLNAVGVDSKLALINSGLPTRASLPSLDQFNHMIVFVPGVDNGTFVDCTARHTQPLQSTELLTGKQALILDPAGPRLAQLPPPRADTALLSVERNIRVIRRGDAELRETLTFDGHLASAMRGFLSYIDPANRRAFVQRQMFSGTPNLELKNLEVESLEDPMKPLVIRSECLLRAQFHEVGDQLLGRLPAPWEHGYIAPDSSSERITPFEVILPRMIRCQVTIASPEGYRVPAPESFSKDLSSAFASGRFQCVVSNNILRVETEIRQPTGQYSSSDYSAFSAAMEKATRLLEPDIVLKVQ